MDQEQARSEAEAFLRQYLEEKDYLRAMPPLPAATAGDKAGAFRLERVAAGASERALEVYFVADFVFDFADPGVHRRANHCLAVLHRARPELKDFTFEISVERPQPSAP
jgi:hypothetical protein